MTTVREYLPEGDFSIMTEMLKKFLSFMNLTVSNTHFKLIYVDISVILFSVNISWIFRSINIFQFFFIRALLSSTESHFSFIILSVIF